MVRNLIHIYQWANRHSGKLFIFGLIGVSVYNLYQWKQYGKFSERKTQLDYLPPTESWLKRPKVSVLVAAWNEAALIKQHINSFFSLRYPHKELIICAGGSDETYSIAQSSATEDVIVLQQTLGQGKQRALRTCFRECTGEIIYLTDADCILDDESFERVIYPIACGEEDACSGGSLPFEDSLCHPLVAIQAACDYVQFTNPDGPQYYPGLLGRNCALRKKVIHSVGEFVSNAPTGTDYLLAKQVSRNNIRIKQVRNSLIRTEYPQKSKDYIMQKRRWHRNVILYSMKYKNPNEFIRSTLLSIVSVFMLLLPFCSLGLGFKIIYLWLLPLLFGILSRKRYLQIWGSTSKSKTPIGSRWLLHSLFLDFIGWSFAFLDIISPRQRYTW